VDEMKADSSTQPPRQAMRPHDTEAPPLPPPPPPPEFFEDDHYFDDDIDPSWWSSIRPLSASRAANPPPPRELEVGLDADDPSLDLVLRPPPSMRRARARTANDEVCATTHVLRVRSRLTPDEQRAFDELMRGPSATDIITMLVNRTEEDAVENLRRRLDDEPSAADTSKRTLATQIIAVSALLSTPEKTNALAALAGLHPEELHALQLRLLTLSPPEAAALIRTYLAPRRR
jgi:hypothetical protein